MTAAFDPAEAARLVAELRRCKYCRGVGRSGPDDCFSCLFCEGSGTLPNPAADQLEAAAKEVARLQDEVHQSLELVATEAQFHRLEADDLTRLRALESRLLALFETADPEVISQTMEMVIRDRDVAATKANAAIATVARMLPVVDVAETLYVALQDPDNEAPSERTAFMNAVSLYRKGKP